MSYFSSEYECKLDAKGRMVLPARIKSVLPEESEMKVTIRRGFEPCLTLYPQNEWDKIFNRVVSLDEFNREQRNFQRSFLRGCTEVELDKTGRFLIPKTMLRYANIEKEAILVGMGNRLEIWNPATYDEFLIQDEEEFSDMAEKYLSNISAAPEPSGVVVNINRAEINEQTEDNQKTSEQS